MIWEEFSRVLDFFFDINQHSYHFHGSQSQVSDVINSIDFNIVESCSTRSDELTDHQNSSDIWLE